MKLQDALNAPLVRDVELALSGDDPRDPGALARISDKGATYWYSQIKGCSQTLEDYGLHHNKVRRLMQSDKWEPGMKSGYYWAKNPKTGEVGVIYYRLDDAQIPFKHYVKFFDGRSTELGDIADYVIGSQVTPPTSL